MVNKEMINNKSCALLLKPKKCCSPSKCKLIFGKLVANDKKIFFIKNPCESFPLPQEWEERIVRIPPEKKALVRGRAYCIELDMSNAIKKLKLFDIESRWEASSP